MKKMLRHQVIDYGFVPATKEDERLTLDGNDFNDYHFGNGWSKALAMQFAIELIRQSGIEPSKTLLAEASAASTQEHGEDSYNLAIRFFHDKTEENAEFERNLMGLIEAKRARRQAIIDAGGFPEDETEQTPHVTALVA